MEKSAKLYQVLHTAVQELGIFLWGIIFPWQLSYCCSDRIPLGHYSLGVLLCAEILIVRITTAIQNVGIPLFLLLHFPSDNVQTAHTAHTIRSKIERILLIYSGVLKMPHFRGIWRYRWPIKTPNATTLTQPMLLLPYVCYPSSYRNTWMHFNRLKNKKKTREKSNTTIILGSTRGGNFLRGSCGIR